ncbi:tetratricopeptide repeat protein [Streptomyces sp. H10-C2]|uniref:tetratricopeptide repeat protein n=1 Tax=unclassified Streptomyces TaxID=2593676 RepID=UPI0024B8868E|nr:MULTISPECIES: tetratricopeptide repeat protein [unclassified Streptomyces]MDJ0346470.1 tetratricopeptide repeat protein [Streptomyces sp. PH10-H1]MDJ0374409.1 tetratricopeptide repeat protein [Streptomyces sp. H10-C2]
MDAQQRTAKADPQDELAARLRLLQELSGLGVRALARDTGLSSSSLSRYLNGQTVPPWPAVIALCRLVQRDPRPLRPVWERSSNPLPAPPKTSRQGRPRPRNDLPRDVPDFTGRAAQLAAVLAAVDSQRVVAVDGMAGVGKTCLAVHAAHRLAAHYPDAQLYVDLHGFTEGRQPLDPDSALRMLLAALDVPSEKVPQEGVERLAACWRAELARRRAVVVLDNAADADQVRPLLPGAGPSVALITSRNRLLGLDEVPPVSLDVLSEHESAQLLARASGELSGPDSRLAREPQSTAEVLRLCGHLPLALRLAAARLRHRPGWTMGILVERMAQGRSEFDTAFAMSVRQLNRAQARLFRMLGLLPGATFDEYAAAALADVPLRAAGEMLEDLLDAHLVQQPTAGRYRLHDLVHSHARRAGAQQDAPAERERALGRMLDYYVHAAAAADAAMPFLSPGRPASAGRPPAALPQFTDKNTAFAWLVTEYANLLGAFETAAATGADVHVCELPRFLRAYFARRCGTTHLNALFERSLAAAQRLGDPLHLAEAHSDLGFARYNAGRMAEAAAAYEAAGPLLSQAGDLRAEAELALRRGYLRWDAGGVEEPLELFQLAGTLYEQAGCPTGAAHAAASQAWAMLQLGHRQEAAQLARQVLAIPHADPAWPPTLTARITLGVAIAHEEPEAAAEHLHQALALAREDGHLHNEAWCLNCLGVALRQMGRYQEALASHRKAFALLDELFEEHWKIHFLNGYGETCRLAGLPEQALQLHRQALELAPALGYRHEEALAHEGIAIVLDQTDPTAAAEHRAAGQAVLQEPNPGAY